MYPTRLVADLTVLGRMIVNAFSSSTGLVFIVDHQGTILAVSKENLINPFSLVTRSEHAEFSTTSYITNASIHSLDQVTFPWIPLVPALGSIASPWSTSSLPTGWRVDIVQVAGVAGRETFAVVVTERSQYTDDFMHSLYISILVLGGIPVVALIGWTVYYAIRKLFAIQSHIIESRTNI